MFAALYLIMRKVRNAVVFRTRGTVHLCILLNLPLPPRPPLVLIPTIFARALRRYNKAILYADGVPPGEVSDDEEGDEADGERKTESEKETDDGAKEEDAFVDLKVAILCNQAACHLKLGDGAAALEAADRASQLKSPSDPAGGTKATYRRACALEAVGDWEESRRAFKTVLDVDPKNVQCVQVMGRNIIVIATQSCLDQLEYIFRASHAEFHFEGRLRQLGIRADPS